MRRIRVIVLCVVATACGEQEAPADRASQGPDAAAAACDEAAARGVVEQLGARMKDVSLLAPDTILGREMRRAYGEIVTPQLLDLWLRDPAAAPGRQVSSPWPERIEIRSIVNAADAADPGCRVEGDVVFITSTDDAGSAAARVPVTISVRQSDRWRISAYAADASTGGRESNTSADRVPAQPDDQAADTSSPGAVIEQYYAAINAGDFQRAYSLWGGEGEASGQSFDEFTAGFSQTARVNVDIGTPGRIEGAAGSRYIAIPVTITAQLDDGTRQMFAGTYTLRRSVVDGATPEQRSWRIHSADVRARPRA